MIAMPDQDATARQPAQAAGVLAGRRKISPSYQLGVVGCRNRLRLYGRVRASRVSGWSRIWLPSTSIPVPPSFC